MSRSNPTQQAKRTLSDRSRPIGFGKYAHESLQDILDTDPAYILWLDENTDIDIACDVLTEAQENNSPMHAFKGYSQAAYEAALNKLNKKN